MTHLLQNERQLEKFRTALAARQLAFDEGSQLAVGIQSRDTRAALDLEHRKRDKPTDSASVAVEGAQPIFVLVFVLKSSEQAPEPEIHAYLRIDLAPPNKESVKPEPGKGAWADSVPVGESERESRGLALIVPGSYRVIREPVVQSGV